MNKLKHHLYIALILGISFSACKKELEIEPKQSISAEQALNTPSDVQNALIGAYTVMAKGSLYGTNLVFIPDVYASEDYLRWTGTFTTYRDISNKNLIATNEDARRTWVDAYAAINVANTVISALDVVTNPDQKNTIEGKALFIRGIMHFELVRLYAQPYDIAGANTGLGVPIMLKATKSAEDISTNVPRSSIIDVYKQVETDLQTAIQKLNGKDEQYAAMAMLARVYLQESKFDLARNLANDIINNSPYAFLNNLEAPFRVKNSSEGIFEIQQNEQSNAGSSNDGLATFYSSYLNATGGKVGRGDASVNMSFYNSFEAGDKRKSEMIYEGNGAKTGFFTKKWYNYFDNIPVARITEQYLIRAECNFRLGTALGATPSDDLNKIRTRANLGNIPATLNAILNERERELAYEGFRLHDYKRTKRSIGSYPYNSAKLVFPIPDREMKANTGLYQNDGYNP